MNKYLVLGPGEVGGYKVDAGSIVLPSEEQALRAHEVPTIPIQDTALGRHPLAGFAHRAYGARGHELPEAIPRVVCSLTLYALPGFRRIHWRAALRLAPGFTSWADVEGSLRLGSDSSQPGAYPAGVSAVNNPQARITGRDLHLGEGADYLVGGDATHSPAGECYVGLCLYGAVRGARVAWFAVSQTE